MLELCGFSASNYYNEVKFALLEKGIPFQEYLDSLGQRPHAHRVNAERKAAVEAFVAHRAQLQAGANVSAAPAG